MRIVERESDGGKDNATLLVSFAPLFREKTVERTDSGNFIFSGSSIGNVVTRGESESLYTEGRKKRNRCLRPGT